MFAIKIINIDFNEDWIIIEADGKQKFYCLYETVYKNSSYRVFCIENKYYEININNKSLKLVS